MLNLKEKTEMLGEILEVIDEEFNEKDGTHYGVDTSGWGYVGWKNWLSMACEAYDYRWPYHLIMHTANLLHSLKGLKR
jgi:hypothetical protein